MEYCKNLLYNFVVGRYTKKLYADFFNKIDEGSYILDIGVGNGSSICDNRDIIIERDLKVLAIDVDRKAIAQCSKNVIEAGLEDRVSVKVFDFFDVKEKFDFIYFSNSYSVIPSSEEFVKKALELLRNNGCVFISTTLFNTKDFVMEKVKYYLKWIALGVDFGRCITHHDFKKDMLSINGDIIDKRRIVKRWAPYFGSVEIYTMQVIKGHL